MGMFSCRCVCCVNVPSDRNHVCKSCKYTILLDQVDGRLIVPNFVLASDVGSSIAAQQRSTTAPATRLLRAALLDAAASSIPTSFVLISTFLGSNCLLCALSWYAAFSSL